MRIVGGRFRGRRLETPRGGEIRPTSDRARQALFNLLAHGPYGGPGGPMPVGRAVLDVFAGTGALGLEALSRGARHVQFIESDREARRLVRRNAAALADEAEVTVSALDATRPGPAPRAYDLILMDPPYGSGLAASALKALLAEGWLARDAVVVVELGKAEDFEVPAGFDLVDQRRYGAACLHILRRRT